METKTSEKNRKETFHNYYQTLQLLSESTDDYLFLADFSDGRIYFARDNMSKRYGLPLDQNTSCLLSDWAAIIHERDLNLWWKDMEEVQKGVKDVHDMLYRLVEKNSHLVWISCRGKVLKDEDGHPMFMIGRISDTALLGQVDKLTGLFLGTELYAGLRHTIESGKSGVLMVLGVDSFKNINAKYGRGYGNQVLRKLASYLESCVDNMLSVYRLDSDRFAVNFAGYTEDEVRKVYQTIQSNLKENCTISAGAVCYPILGVKDANIIFNYAERSLDRAKQNGRNCLVFFSAEDYEKQLSHIDLTEELRKSVRKNCEGFYLVYQPQVSADGYRVVGAETLLRFRSPYRGVVPPNEFIGILEQSGMIIPVGDWVLKEAIRQCAKWRTYHPEFRMSINISYVQLENRELSQHIYDLLEENGLPGDAVVLELTESMQLQNYTKYNQLFYQWGKRGIQISMDDFGTGYSSLGYLKSLAVDEIKVDRCFISHIDANAYNYRLLSNILELARSCQIRVVCEGVETIEELQSLSELAPEELQGFYFSKPLEPQVFEEHYILEHGDEIRWQEDRKKKIQSQKQRQVDAAEYKQLLDQMDEVIYVIDVETHELCYMNYAAQRLTGIGENYGGRKCYEVIKGCKKACEDCMNGHLKYHTFVTGKEHNEYLGSHMLIRDKYMNWNGRKAHLHIGMDMSMVDSSVKELQDSLAMENALVQVLRRAGVGQTDENIMSDILQQTSAFYQADRISVFIHLAEKHVWHNFCAWCAHEVARQQKKTEYVPEETVTAWMEALEQGKEIVVKDVSCYKEAEPELYALLHGREIRRVMVAPIIKEEKLYGFIGIDNSKAFPYDPRFLQKVASVLSGYIEL